MILRVRCDTSIPAVTDDPAYSAAMAKRIGILTGGGDCPGLNGVIRSVVLHARNTYGWEVVGVRNGFEGLYEEDYVDLEPQRVSLLLSRGGTMLGSSNRANPFAYPIKLPDGRVEIMDASPRILQNLAKLGLEGLIVVGGDGTMSFAKKFVDKGAKIVGVPKTIDNDVWGTDRTFGFDTAVEIVTQAIDRLYTTAESHHRVMLVEVMGRHSGFIALHAGLAGGAEVILLPEIPFDPRRIAAKVEARARRGRNYSIVVVAEGARAAGGHLVFREGDGGDELHSRLGGVSAEVADALRALTRLEVRHIVLGHVQRGGTPTAYDRMLASWMGQHAVSMLARDEGGAMVALHGTELRSVPLEAVVQGVRRVEVDGALVRAARQIGVSFAAADGGDDPPGPPGKPTR